MSVPQPYKSIVYPDAIKAWEIDQFDEKSLRKEIKKSQENGEVSNLLFCIYHDFVYQFFKKYAIITNNPSKELREHVIEHLKVATFTIDLKKSSTAFVYMAQIARFAARTYKP